MYDPFQTYATMGSPYYGTLNPVGMPYNAQQTFTNPLAAIHPLAAATLGLSPGNPTINPITGVPQAGQQGYGLHPAQNFINPQQLQLASALASQAVLPQLLGISPLAGIQNPIVAALLTNPLIPAGLHAQFGQQQFAQPQFGQPQFWQPQFGQPQLLNPQFGQIGSPYGQVGPTAGIGYPLAPQSWVGQPGQLGGAQAYGQIHPLLAQLASRSLQGQGISPWGY